MKKTIVLLAILVIVLVSSSAVVVMMATGILDKGTEESITPNNVNNDKAYIKYQLVQSDIDITEEHSGIVKYTNESKECFYQEKIGGKFQVFVKTGDMVKKGDILYYDNNGKSIVAKNDLLIVGLKVDTDMYMETFMYEDSQICLSIPSKYQNILGDITFLTMGDDDKEIPLKLESINTCVNDGKIEVSLKNEFQVLDNTEIKIIVKYYTISGKIAVPSQYVFFDNGDPYVHIIDDGEEDYYIDVYDFNNEIYVINDNLDGATIGYTLEEKYMNNSGE